MWARSKASRLIYEDLLELQRRFGSGESFGAPRGSAARPRRCRARSGWISRWREKQKARTGIRFWPSIWSGKRDSNPRPSAWEALQVALAPLPRDCTASHRLRSCRKTLEIRRRVFRTPSHRPHRLARGLLHPCYKERRPGRGESPRYSARCRPVLAAGYSRSGRLRRISAFQGPRSTSSAPRATSQLSGWARRCGSVPRAWPVGVRDRSDEAPLRGPRPRSASQPSGVKETNPAAPGSGVQPMPITSSRPARSLNGMQTFSTSGFEVQPPLADLGPYPRVSPRSHLGISKRTSSAPNHRFSITCARTAAGSGEYATSAKLDRARLQVT